MPNGTVGFLSTQVLTETEIENFLSNSDPSIHLEKVFTRESWIFLTKHEKKQSFLIWSQMANSFDRQNFIKQLSANLNPNIHETKLADGTISREILIDPDLDSVEEITIQGKIFLHSKTQKNEEYFLSKQEDLIFSNNEEDVRSFLDGNGPKSDSICHGNSIGVIFSRILEEENSLFFSTASIARNIEEKFHSLGIQSSNKSINISLCT